MKKELIFLSGNKNKYLEIASVLGENFVIKQENIDLFELQSLSCQEVIEKKLKDSFDILKKEVFCEDTGLIIENMNGFPGALTKFYLKIGLDKICKFHAGEVAYAQTIIGYHNEKIHFFEGKIKGNISSYPRGNGFGWDPIFIPENFNKSFAELSFEEKNKISMRAIAASKFKNFLEKNIEF